MSRAGQQTVSSGPMSRRIAPLATLPLFHRLSGRPAVVAGTSAGALWKAELLAAAGAVVTLLAGDAADARRLAERVTEGAGRLEIVARPWRAADLAGAAIAVADLAPDEAAAFAAAARAAGVPVNLVDRPGLSDFQFGALVNRSPLIVAISTGGGAPVLAQELRARLEALLPLRLADWAEAAGRWRPSVRRLALTFGERRLFWERFAALAWREGERAPDAADRAALFRTLGPALAGSRGGEERAAGRVVLVGAGPGDPELLTLAALRALQSATVIFHEPSVPAATLELARREARRIVLPDGLRDGRAELARQMAALAAHGEYVVRLGRGEGQHSGSELYELRRAGVAIQSIRGLAARPSAEPGGARRVA